MTNRITIIIPNELKKEIDYLKEVYNEEQSALIRKLLWRSIKQERVEYALSLYLEDKISLGKAAEIAKNSIWEILEEVKKRNIPLKYKIADAELEIQKILKKHGKIE